MLRKIAEKLGLARKPKVWFGSDFHFHHANVIKYCDRPYKDVDEMDSAIIKQWNSQVGPDDEVWVLGDFSLNPKWSKIIVPQLNGRKHLISGNHDATFPHDWDKKGKWKKMVKRYEEDGWESIAESAVITVGELGLVHLSHMPPLVEGFDDRFPQHRPRYHPKNIYLHGHLHNKYKRRGNMLDVGFDVELRLFSEQDIIDTFNGPENQPGRPMVQVEKDRKDMIG